MIIRLLITNPYRTEEHTKPSRITIRSISTQRDIKLYNCQIAAFPGTISKHTNIGI